MISMGYFLIIQSRKLAARVVKKKIQHRWKSKSKRNAEFKKKLPKSLLTESGPRTGAIIITENRF
jgi:hypothetical protein